MSLPSSFDRVLRLLDRRLKNALFPWALTGSMGMWLQGMTLQPRDIDLQTHREGAYQMQSLFPEYITVPVFFKASERIRSHFGTIEIEGVAVEVMGEMEKLRPDGLWEPAPDLPSVTRWVEYAGMRLPVLDLAYEVESYRLMGREAKAELIRAFLAR